MSIAQVLDARAKGLPINYVDTIYRGPTQPSHRHPEQNPIGPRMNEGWQFQNPTLKGGPLAQAMSRISCDPSSAAQASLLRTDDLNNKLFDQTQLALAVHLGVNGLCIMS